MKRLLAMGITEGTALTVVQHGEGLVIRCQDTRWALGRGMAHKILVTDLQG
jgi:Fe2+ transport system protein FeoA